MTNRKLCPAARLACGSRPAAKRRSQGGIYFRPAVSIPPDGLYMTNLWYDEEVL
ncbi:MAG: hypothetical protein K2P01_05315 [Oscillospiraceae bacterium]|nr:hypothetical protein [Oscillospiraceae bacterium]